MKQGMHRFTRSYALLGEVEDCGGSSNPVYYYYISNVHSAH